MTPERIEERFQEFQSKIDSLKEYVGKLSSEIFNVQELNTKLSNKIDSETQRLDSYLESLQALNRSHFGLDKSHRTFIENSTSLFNSHKSLIDRTKDEVIELQTKVNHLSPSFDQHVKKCNDSFDGCAKDALAKNNDMVSLIKSIKEEINKSFDAYKIDLQNATLRSSNTANQMLIAEKKIENIYLLLKKHELSQ